MKLLFKMIIVLGMVSTLSGFLLAYVNKITISEIEKNQKEEISSAIYNLIPEAKKYHLQMLSDYKIYYVYNKKGQLLGYGILTSGNGYQGEIKILIGLSPDLVTLKGIEILENVETPGLGGKISQPDFQHQFNGRKFSPRIEYVKRKKPQKDNEIQAITGATVSSSSVVRIVNNTLSKVIPLLKNHPCPTYDVGQKRERNR